MDTTGYFFARTAGLAGPVWIGLFLAVLIVAAGLRLMNHNASLQSPDERTYQFYAERVVSGSTKATGELVQEYNSSEARWVYPTPVRVGYYYLLAAVMKCTCAPAGQAGVGVSSFFSILQFLFVAVIGLRFFDRWTALVALAFLSVCPMELAIARRVWQDGVAGCVGLMLFYFCMEASLSSRKGAWLGLFWLFGAWFLTIKESTVPVFCLYSLWLVVICRLKKCPPGKCALIAAGCALTGLFSFAVMAWLSGGISNFLAVIEHNKQSMHLNQYAINFQNGPWYSHMLGWWILSPVPATLCLICMAAWIMPGRIPSRVLKFDDEARLVTWAMVLIALIVTVMATVPPYLKNLRYVTFIYGPCYLLGGIGLRYLWTLCKEQMPAPARRWLLVAVTLLIAGTMAADFSTFHRVFIKEGMNDLAIIRLIDNAFQSSATQPAPGM